jgi:hypothetical protein
MDKPLQKILLLMFVLILPALFSIPARAAETVKVGIYINDIQALDVESHSYKMDFYMWFKWKNPKIDPSTTIEFMNSYELWGHSHVKNYEKPKLLEGGEYYQIVRVQGGFSHKFDLRDYPFDNQKLLISFEDNEHESDEVVYVLDESSPIAMSPKIVFPGFELREPKIAIEKIVHASGFGLPTPNNKSEYDRVVVEIPIHRPVFTYAVKLLLPILCVVFVAALMFLFSPTYIESRVSIGITAILTTVALQITLADNLPDIDYLVLIDKIYIVTYTYIVIGLFLVLKGSWHIEKERKTIAEISRMDFKYLTVLTVTYFLICGVIILSRLLPLH